MKKALSIKRIIKSFGYAINGVKDAYKDEPNMKIHVLVATVVILVAFILKVSTLEWLILLLLIGLVIAAEVLNTSLENFVDLVTKKQDPLAGKVKDTAAGFVMVLAILSAAVGLIIFIPKFILLIEGKLW